MTTAPDAADAALQSEIEQLRTTVAQLQYALDSRVIIEQAKGVLAERHHIGVDAAFEMLRSHARSNALKLHDVAADVVAGLVQL